MKRFLFEHIINTDFFYQFRRSPRVIFASFLILLIILSAVFAPLLTPHRPFDPGTLELMDARKPPFFQEEGSTTYPLGTDDQGRDVLAIIMYGSRISLIVGFGSVLLAMAIGISVGLLSGYTGGWIDSLFMRLADIQLTFPSILIALLIDSIARILFTGSAQDEVAILILILAIGISTWPQYARMTRSGAMVEKGKDYIAAARIIKANPRKIMFRHILPNIMGPNLVLATLGLAGAVIVEATLSFLGIGIPPTTPSLGTLIRIGNDYLFSGEWWITIFPAVALVILVLSINLLGDWLRDVLNPKLQ